MRAAIDTGSASGVKAARSAFASLSRAPEVVDNHSMMSDWSDEETDDPLVADTRNFYKAATSIQQSDNAHAIPRPLLNQEWPPR
jgi:hypothetical protein